MIKTSHLSTAFVTGSLLLGSAAQGAVIFNNFGPGDSFSIAGRLLSGEDVVSVGNVDQAVSFLVSGGNYRLTTASLGVNVVSTPSPGTGLIDIILAEDNGGLPGAALESATLNVTSTGSQVITAGFSGATELSAGGTYWIIADARTTFDSGWGFNSIGDTGDTAGRSAPSGTFNYGSWNLRTDDDRMALRVEGRVQSSGVPDSGASALALLPVLGMLWFGRRQAQSR